MMAEMNQLKLVKTILTKSTVNICDNLDPKPLLGIMLSEDALTPNDVTMINSKMLKCDQSSELLTILMHKQATAYETFKDALQQKGRKDIYDSIVVIEREVGYTRPSAGTTPSASLSSGASAGPSTTHLDAIVEDSHMTDFVDELTSNQLSFVYEKLHIPHTKVVKAHEKADTKDPDLKAKAVLRYWKEINAENATRRRLLQALEDCNYNLAKLTLEKKWGNS